LFFPQQASSFSRATSFCLQPPHRGSLCTFLPLCIVIQGRFLSSLLGSGEGLGFGSSGKYGFGSSGELVGDGVLVGKVFRS